MIAVVVPAFNAERSISKVIKDLKGHGYSNIIVVDDGSTDATAEIAKRHATVIRHRRNLGQGAALRSGIRKALALGADAIVTFDADGQHRAADLRRLCEPVLAGKAEVALGSRFLGKSKIPLGRVLLLKAAIFTIWLFYGVWMSDAHNGLRCLSRRAAKAIRITEPRMAHASEIVEQIVLHQLKYVEVPVRIRYSRANFLAGLAAALRILWAMLRKKFFKSSSSV